MSDQGRWTIGSNENGPWFEGRAPFPLESVPVVPCDAAAVDRVVDTLVRSYRADFARRPVFARQIALSVLRAAGETP